jgi:hypothetical protein
MSQGLSAPCSLLEWDSAFLGFRVAQVTGDRLSIKGGRGVLEWSQAQTIRCLYFLADASSPETADAAHKLSFKMVDLRIQFILDRKRRGTATDTKVELRAPLASDVPALERIARSAHQDSRFFFDSGKNIPGSYNNSIWFYADSKYVMWLFGVEGIQVLLRTRMRSMAQGAIIAAVGLMVSVPSAIKHFIWFNSAWRSGLLPAQAVDALNSSRLTRVRAKWSYPLRRWSGLSLQRRNAMSQ